MNSNLQATKTAQRGMSLIEVLIGIAIGILALVVMFQTVTVWDARTRAMSAGSDAQVIGTIAMFNLERDVRLGGMGYGEARATEMGCTVNAYDGAASAPFNFRMQPVFIVDNDATDTPDEISVLYGNSPYFGATGEFTSSTTHSLSTVDRVGFKAGDLAIVAGNGGPPGSANCNLIEVTSDATAGDRKTLRFDPGATYNSYYVAASTPQIARYNSASGVGTTYTSGKVFSLGPRPHRNNWTIVNNSLGYSDDIVQATGFFPIADGVIDMKAFYGFDADNSGTVADNEWTKSLPANADWRLVRALKVFMLTRSQQFEKQGAASTADQSYLAVQPTYRPSAASAPVDFVMRNVNGTPDSAALGDPNNWRHYRYFVYERVIPLRNVNWPQPVALP